MVEVGDKSKEVEKLNSRVKNLAWELDRSEQRFKEASDAFQSAVRVLAGLLKGGLPKVQAKALQRVVKVMKKTPLDPEKLQAEVGELKKAVLTMPKGSDPVVKATDPKTGAPMDKSAAGRHVALALLEGLRLGDRDYDARLEQGIKKINRFISANQVRPAMSELVDVLDLFREAQELRLRKAEKALKEVLGEVLQTSDSLTETMDKTQSGLDVVSQDFDKKFNASVGKLAKAITQADELDILKAAALTHLRAMRQGLQDRRSRETQILQETRRQLETARQSLGEMRQKMQAVERDSQRLNREALTDPLTKAFNKRAFTRQVAASLATPDEWPLSLVMIDIDHFKGVNDNYGHQAGDRALVAITQRATTCLRKQDILFRYAGDEFVILLRKTDLKEAMMVAERVRQATANIRFTFRGEGEIRITVSLGVGVAKAGDTLESFFERADQALLEAKRAGRDQVTVAE